MLKVHLVNYEQGHFNGILTKFAKKLYEGLIGDKEFFVSIGQQPREDVDINHHINYIQYKPNNTKNTLMVTHITTDYKLDKAKKAMETADVGSCMS